MVVVGSAGVGKSTLISVLTRGRDGAPSLDNGRGGARLAVLRHKHEIDSGRTSSITHHTIGYDAANRVLNYQCRLALPTPREVAEVATNMVRLTDCGGQHTRFGASTLFGVTATLPHGMMICVSSRSRAVDNTMNEFLDVAFALGIKVFIVLTKTDTVVGSNGKNTKGAAIDGVLQQRQWGRAVHVKSKKQAQNMACALCAGRPFVPIFNVSSVTGAGVEEVHAFLAAFDTTSATAQGTNTTNTTHFQIDSIMQVADVGTVLSGIVVSGQISVGDRLLMGPLLDRQHNETNNGTDSACHYHCCDPTSTTAVEGGKEEAGEHWFESIVVSSIHRAQVDVDTVVAGQHATIGYCTSSTSRTTTIPFVSSTSSSSSSLLPSSSWEDDVDDCIEGQEYAMARRKTSPEDLEMLGRSWSAVVLEGSEKVGGGVEVRFLSLLLAMEMAVGRRNQY